MRRSWTAVFATLLAVAMAGSTFAVSSAGVLASTLIGEFGISRTQVGGLVTAFAVFATVLSIPAGRVTDRIGGRNGVALVFAGAALGLVGLGLAPGFGLLLAAMAIGGIGNSVANPGTNHLIAEYLEPGKRGVIIGIKMSGVQLGVVVAGVVLPIGIRTIGWRPSMLIAAALPVAGLVVLLRFLPSGTRERHAVDRLPLPPTVWVLAGYTFLMSMSTNAIFAYLPLFAEEAIGLTLAKAGLVVALAGAVSIPARIVWGLGAERSRSLIVPLVVVSVAAAVSTGGLLVADRVGEALLWTAALAFGLTGGSYNAAATMVLIRSVPPARTGRATGVVFTGFLGGVAVGPLVFARLVDVTETYRPSLLAVTVLYAVCAVIPLVGSRPGWTAKRA